MAGKPDQMQKNAGRIVISVDAMGGDAGPAVVVAGIAMSAIYLDPLVFPASVNAQNSKDLINVHKVSARELKIKKTYSGDNWEFATRNQLMVETTMRGEEFAFIVNHCLLEERLLGVEKKQGDLNRLIIDTLRTITPNLHIVTMGDFNDDPNDKSISKSLGAVGNPKKLNDKNHLYNPMFNMHKSGLGTLAYRDSWNLFDQIIISKELKSKEDRYKGYPLMTSMPSVHYRKEK